MSDYKLDLVDKSLRAFCFPLIENQRKIIGTDTYFLYDRGVALVQYFGNFF